MTAQQGGVPILMYHRIATGASQCMQRFTVHPKTLAAQLHYLSTAGFAGLTVGELVARRQKGTSLPAKPVVLTFDDGFRDFYTDAFPLLRQYGFPATLYMVAGEIGGTSRWLDGEDSLLPLLSADELDEVAGFGVEIGAHSMSHPALDLLPDDALQAEIARSKETLEAHLGRAVTTFCYPFGFADVRVRQMVRSANFTSACSVRYRMHFQGDDAFDLPRHIVTGSTRLSEFINILEGRPALKDLVWNRTRSRLGAAGRKLARLVQ